MKVHIERSFADLPETIQRTLSQSHNNPFFNAQFLQLLEQSDCVGANSGWSPQHLWIEKASVPVFFMPLYRKSHSWGEFVFDQSWAQAYERVGLQYYPKLVTSIPFTPSLGPRWWCHVDVDEGELLALAVEYIDGLLLAGSASSWHLLFSNTPPTFEHHNLLARRDTQFHWINRSYSSFDGFLQQLKSRKRKCIRREREKVKDQGVVLQRKRGPELTPKNWRDFYRCYCNTYHERGMNPHLSEAFFQKVSLVLPDNIMMVQALRGEVLIGAAIFFFDDKVLYGRHWGAIEQVDCLHFEACFYQGIEFCIENGLQRFDPGTQGEHKLLRGFEPIQTDSWHLIGHSAFRDAIADFVQSESSHVERYHASAENYLPFKNCESD